MLNELETQNRKAARDSFIAAVWEGKEPSELLMLAVSAGLNGTEADRLISRIRQGKEQIEQVRQLPRLRKEAAGAKSRFEKVELRTTAAIERLEAEAATAAMEADDAQKALRAVEPCAQQLLAMHDEGLLPLADLPQEVLDLIRRREAEAQFNQADSVRGSAIQERDRRRWIVRDLERQLAALPLSIISDREEKRLQARLKDANRQLAEMEDRLKTAQAAVDAARKAI